MQKNILTVAVLTLGLLGGVFLSYVLYTENPRTFFEKNVAEVTDSNSIETVAVMSTDTIAKTDHYTNQQFHFSVNIPEGMRPQEVTDTGTLTVAFQSGPNAPGFQVFVTPYTQTHISEERFLLDLPSGVRTNERQIYVDGVPAALFWGTDSIGNTVEIWFIHDGLLYEVTSYRELEASTLEILKTWKFVP